MTSSEAHALLDKVKAGINVSDLQITLALIATGDLTTQQRTYQEPIEVTHAVPEMGPVFRMEKKERPTKPPIQERVKPVIPPLPKIVHKPFTYEPKVS